MTGRRSAKRPAWFAVLELLTFVVCFSLMIILDKSTTHIGIVALTVRNKETERGRQSRDDSHPPNKHSHLTPAGELSEVQALFEIHMNLSQENVKHGRVLIVSDIKPSNLASAQRIN